MCCLQLWFIYDQVNTSDIIIILVLSIKVFTIVPTLQTSTCLQGGGGGWVEHYPDYSAPFLDSGAVVLNLFYKFMTWWSQFAQLFF